MLSKFKSQKIQLKMAPNAKKTYALTWQKVDQWSQIVVATKRRHMLGEMKSFPNCPILPTKPACISHWQEQGHMVISNPFSGKWDQLAIISVSIDLYWTFLYSTVLQLHFSGPITTEVFPLHQQVSTNMVNLTEYLWDAHLAPICLDAEFTFPNITRTHTMP